MTLPPKVRDYLLTGLAGTPDVLDGLLKAIPSGDPLWDFRPDPARFTLREIVAHLADWEPIFLERATRTRNENQPTLPDIDEGRLAVEHGYAHSDPHESLARFRKGRVTLVALLRSLEEADWERRAVRETIGPMTLAAQMVLALGHDGYHTQQVAQWLEAGRR
ncbi:MAG TPA: DinB family protein [Chthonomonadaceae bacterium]|nr:DinB family protein [Chthonomonadaceae bacterium]